MSVRTARRDGANDVQFNLTPMIDIIFQLIIFFMLLSQFAGIENTPVELPALTHGKPEIIKPEDKVAVTVKYTSPGEPPAYQVGPVEVASIEQLSAKLAQVKAFSPNVQMVLRADKRLAYKDIQNVMRIAGQHGLNAIQISVAMEGP